MTKKYYSVLPALIICGFNLFYADIQNASAQKTPSLKEVFRNDFLIGTAINTHQIEEKDTASDRVIKAAIQRCYS